jgi:hypothetical protein
MKSGQPDIFPFVGIVLILLFLFIYNTRKYFKENIRRIFIHPHGFYVDVRDKRKIPVSHTLLVAMFSSIGVGLISATILYFFHEHSIVDHLLTLATFSTAWKTRLIALCWQPGLAVLVFSLLNFASFLIIGIAVKLIALLSRRRWKLSQSITLIFWCGANWMLLVLVGMVLYKVLFYSNTILPTLVILGVFTLWFLARLIKGIRVAFFWTEQKALMVVLIWAGVISTGIMYYFQQTNSLIDFVKYYFTYWLHLI